MATKVPFPYISGALDDRSRFELERNFQYLTDQITSTVTGWDGIVDPSATADNTSTLVFKTIFSAISYLYTTKGLRSISIGVISRDNGTITETAGLSGIANASIRIGLVGWQSSRSAGSHTVSWNLATFTFAGSGTTINVSGLILKGGNTGAFTFQNPQFYASFCQVGDGTTQRWHSGGNYYDCVYNGSADGIFFNCQLNWTNSLTSGTGTTLVAIGGWIQSSGGVTITLSADNIYIVSLGASGNSGGSSVPDTFTVNSAKSLVWESRTDGSDATGSGSVPPVLNITSTVLRRCVIDADLVGIVVPALAAPLTAPCTVRVNLYGYNTGAYTFGYDLTGPCQLEFNAVSQIAAAGGGVLVVRGFGVNGSATFTTVETNNPLTLLKAIGLKRSALTVATKRDTGSGATTGVKVYDIDATSTNNVLIVEADAFGTASVNASGSTLIITDAGITVGGSAGGSLTGTYPNPTFAGRFASVAELDKDFTKHFLMGTL